MTHPAHTRSLIRQTVSITLAAQLLCALILCGAALMHERHTRFRALDMRLQGSSDSLLGTIQDAEDPEDNVLIDPAELSVPAEDVYAVYNQGGRLLGTSPGAPSQLAARGADGFRNVTVHGEAYRVLQREGLRIIDRAESNGVGLKRPVTILYASPERPVWHEIFEAAGFYVVAIAAATALTALLVTLLLRKALAPLTALASAAEQLSPPSLSFTAPASVLRIHELRPLAVVLTTAVERLRESFAKEQRFVGDAAHELKTAIAVVRSSVQVMMLKRRTEEEYKTGLLRVLDDNTRVEALVGQMLELARRDETGKQLASLLDLDAVVQTSILKLAPLAEERGVTLRAETTPDANVRLPYEAAEALLSNLVRNAIQHSDAAGEVIVKTRREASWVTLQVVDMGVGISPEALPHVFERFYREDTSRSRETGGTGLGLSICRSIVQTAGGEIRIESTQRIGTTVTATFRAA